MKKIALFSAVALLSLVISAFSGAFSKTKAILALNPGTIANAHVPFYAVFDADSFYCDPAEAKHQGKVFHRYNTLHMKEKGEDNIIVHFNSKKYTAKNGKPETDYVHFDILYNFGSLGKREDTHLTLTWKGKKYHIKNDYCKFNITKLAWNEDKVHFTFSADFETRVFAGGPDTVTHIFKGKIVDELVKAKATATEHK